MVYREDFKSSRYTHIIFRCWFILPLKKKKKGHRKPAEMFKYNVTFPQSLYVSAKHGSLPFQSYYTFLKANWYVKL